VTSDQRLTGTFAQVPTWKEQGVAGTFNTWRGLWGPKGLNAQQTAYWDDTLQKMAKDPEWIKTLEQNHWNAEFRGSRESFKYLEAVHAELRDALKELGLAKRTD
jgi:putative tricarboxylic transport membrane protein